jgi:MarR family transcriptional regulator, organic hydroperoxide resistance regulator
MGQQRDRLIREFTQAGRESSRLSVLFRSAAAAELGMTVTDGECLDFLLETGAATAGQIAEQTNLTTGAVTSMIRRLQRAGYVTSQRDAADRRKIIVKPVPEKLAAAADIYTAYIRQAGPLLSTYTNDQLAFLTHHYQQLSAIYRDTIKQHTSRR